MIHHLEILSANLHLLGMSGDYEIVLKKEDFLKVSMCVAKMHLYLGQNQFLGEEILINTAHGKITVRCGDNAK